MGADFRAAYASGVALAGTGQSVGLLEFDGYYASDITSYASLAGLTNIPLQNVLLDGFNGVPTGSANEEEVALDIEMVISMATNLSKVVVYEAGTNTYVPNSILSAMAANTSIKQFSCSWDFANQPANTLDAYFQKLSSQGQSFLNASGDSGAYSGAIPQPDDDPYITQVGGTTLATCSPGGAWMSETAWNAGDGYSTSGGISTTYSNSTCTWQQGISTTANQGSPSHRNVPDVAMVADNILIVADQGQQEISGGTSASVQLWAAFVALVNQQAAASSQPSVGSINRAIYALGKSAAFSANFDDIAAGNNTNTITTQFLAVPGYDLCTGWGSPSGGSLIIALARPDGLQISPGRGLTANGPAGGPFNVSDQNLTLTNSGTGALTWSLSSTSLWLTVSPAGDGTLTPGGSATKVSLTLNSAANKLAKGVYTANVWFTNATSRLTQVRQFTVQVGQEMIQDGGFEAGDFAYWNLFGPNLFWTDQYGDLIPFSFVDDGSAYGLTPYAGTYSANLGATDLDYLSQAMPTRVGQPYLLSFWWESVDIGSGTTPNEFLAKWNTSTLANALNVGAFGWTHAQYVVQGTVTNTVLEFGFLDEPGVLGLDAVSVISIPMPSFQTVAKSSSTIRLSWATMPGLTYQLQYKTNVTGANWINLGARPTSRAARYRRPTP
jgi:xanthomonalisin